MQVIKVQDEADVNLFCRDTGSIQGRGPNFFSFCICFSYYFNISKIKTFISRKHAVKAAKSNHLSLHRVKICLWKIRSLRGRFTQNWVFLHTLFLENEAQIDRNNYGMMLSMSKQVSLPKISSILQKMKIGQNSICTLFARSPSIWILPRTVRFLHCQLFKVFFKDFRVASKFNSFFRREL